MKRPVVVCETFLAASLCVFAQGSGDAVLKGCVKGGPNEFYFGSVDDKQFYVLRGNTAPLRPYVEKEVSIEGNVDASTKPWPTIRVLGLKQVFPAPKAELAASFFDSAAWQHETNQTYGIEFAHPSDWRRVPGSEWSRASPNFASDQNVIIAGRFEIPREIYPQSNLGGGVFGIYVNPSIANSQSCAEFGDPDPRFRSSRTINHLPFTVFESAGGAMGTLYRSLDFQTFQNGLCYEVAFEFSEQTMDLGCTVPALSEEDEAKVMDPLLDAVSFQQPSVAAGKHENPEAMPTVAEFRSSSEMADGDTNRGNITFSWSSSDADYVEFSYSCTPAPNGPGVVILESNFQRSCENSTMKLEGLTAPNRSPNGSVAIVFGNFMQSAPIAITVRVTPFSRAEAYHAGSKSITVQVNAYKRPANGRPVR